MTDTISTSDIDAPPPTPSRRPIVNRSKGTKLIIVCVLAVLMAIPALLVWGLLLERTHRAETVAKEIGGMVGGPQTFMGPVISVPYVVPRREVVEADGRKSMVDGMSGALIVFPTTGKVTARTKSEVRSRSLFRVPIYTSDMAFDAHFDFSAVAAEAPVGTVLQWDKAELLTGASDSRGARSDIAASIGGSETILAPAKSGRQSFSSDRGALDLDMFAAPANISPDAPVDVSLRMTFTGAQDIAFLAFAKSTDATVTGDWNAPSFGGGFLPVTRALPRDATMPHNAGEIVLDKGFRAEWKIPFIARGLPAVTDASTFSALGKSTVSVSFVEPTNPYKSVGRSLKYALLFVGLVFLTYFVFESTGRSKKELHPAQYILVGLAQITFYLLLLSFAERIGFDAAFAVAATATVLLISGYAGLIFASRWRFIVALAAFTLLYGLIYVLMRLEDYALLVGAVSAFIVIAAVMLLTRNINWYANRSE
jgi:inner membrane protein